MTNESEFSVDESFFKDNSATAGSGGGIQAIFGSRPLITNSEFTANSAEIGCGGGMSVDSSIARVENVIFSKNSALAGGGFNFVNESGSRLSNCTFVENSAAGGGGIFCEYASPQIEMTIIANSSAGGAFTCREASPTISCSDFHGNGGGDWVGHVADQADADGNFSLDPLFCAVEEDAYSLSPSSPCNSENNSCAQPVGAFSRSVCLFTDIDEPGVSALPNNFALEQNYPNPFNPTTIISFSLPHKADITVTVYNVLGEKIRTFDEGIKSAGRHSVTWDSRNASGKSVASGLYLYKVVAGEFTATRKMLLLK